MLLAQWLLISAKEPDLCCCKQDQIITCSKSNFEMKIEAFVKGNRKVICTKLKYGAFVFISDRLGPCHKRFVALGNNN